jgi:hypothetical protein
METKIIAAWCGTGKSFICEKTNIKAIEIEFWKYNDSQKYISDVNEYFNKVNYIFISTDPKGLELLHNEGFNITLAYPKNELRNEYLDRYINRDNPYDFIGTFMKHWDIWINELKEIKFCNHIVLESNQYLLDVIFNKKKSDFNELGFCKKCRNTGRYTDDIGIYNCSH